MGKAIQVQTGKEGEIFCKWLDSRLIKHNKNVLGAELGPTGCLLGSTIVSGQIKTLDELYSSGEKVIDTFSITQGKSRNNGSYYPKKSKSEIIDSGIKEVFEIELEDGRKVFTTAEHKLFKVINNKPVEEIVSNLKVGDDLKAYPKDYAKDYFKRAKVKEQKKRDLNYNPQSNCKKCNCLFYQTKKGRGHQTPICKHCGEQNKKYLKNHWYEWEDNLLKQFYYSYSKENLMILLPLRNSWGSIMHRAHRLGLKRKKEFQWEQNAFTSDNNPVRDPISFEKMMKRQAPIFKRNKMTSIEKKIADFLDKNKISYEYNKVVRTKTSFRFPDFQIGNLIIECDGIYWHKNRKVEDKLREDELKELGFEIIRFNDKEINNNWEEVKKCIQVKLNQ